MKLLKLFFSFFLLSLFGLLSTTFAYKELIISNIDNKPVRVIKIILDGEHYIVSSVAMTWWNTLENLTKNVGGNTSINGVFFCPSDYSYCNNTTFTISERVYKGYGERFSRYRWDTWIRGVFGFTKNGEPLYVQNNLTQAGLNLNTNASKLNEIFFGLGNFPVLLVHGEDVLWWSEHEFDKKMKSKGNKHFICSTSNNNTIYMGVVWQSTMYDMPEFLKKNFNCYNAINLDAGYSAGMVYDGKILQKAHRKMIMDAFVVLTKEEYKKLTNYTPPDKTPYDPGPQYQRTNKDELYTDKMETLANKIINQKSKEIRGKLIWFFRSLTSKEKYLDDQQAQARFHEILIRLYTIDYL